jgi:hypothetical protein
MLRLARITNFTKLVFEKVRVFNKEFSTFYKIKLCRFSQHENFEEYRMVYDSKIFDEKSINLAKSIKITDACDKVRIK